MEIRSFFYIDENEFYGISNQLIDNIKDVECIEKLESKLEGGLSIPTSNLTKKFLPEIALSGALNGVEENKINIQISIEEKVQHVLEKIEKIEDILELWIDNRIRDGQVIVGAEEFVLVKIFTDKEVIENFDHINNLDYILARLKEDDVLVFEANSFINRNTHCPPVIMKMTKSKMFKRIHHYSGMICEYQSFRFKIIGEINRTSKNILINPIVVWR